MIEVSIEVWTKEGQASNQRKLFKSKMEALMWGQTVLMDQLGAAAAQPMPKMKRKASKKP